MEPDRTQRPSHSHCHDTAVHGQLPPKPVQLPTTMLLTRRLYRAAAAAAAHQLAQCGVAACHRSTTPPRTLGRPLPTLDVAVSSSVPHVWPPAPSLLLLHCSLLLLSTGSRSLAIQPWSTLCLPVSLKTLPSSARSWYQTGDICRGVVGGGACDAGVSGLVGGCLLTVCMRTCMCVPCMNGMTHMGEFGAPSGGNVVAVAVPAEGQCREEPVTRGKGVLLLAGGRLQVQAGCHKAVNTYHSVT